MKNRPHLAHSLIDHELVNDLASAYRGKRMRDGIRDMEMAGMPEQVAERFYEALGEHADAVRGELHRIIEASGCSQCGGACGGNCGGGCDCGCGSDCPCMKSKVARRYVQAALKKPLMVLENQADGFEVHVIQYGEKFHVVLFDTDAQEYFPSPRIYPTLERAEAEAKKIVRGDGPGHARLAATSTIEKIASEPLEAQFRALMIKAIKRVGDGVRAMDMGSIVKFNPQERIDTDRYGGIHATFFLRFDHPQVNPTYRPGINFYWDTDKKAGAVGISNLVWPTKTREGLPLNKMGDAMLDAAEDIVKDLKRQLKREQESDEAWSVVTLGKDQGYAAEVEVFSSKAKAEAKARDIGNCYVVKGTQMWNEPLGQVEEHDRSAPYRYFR